jgi:hypothetical protein
MYFRMAGPHGKQEQKTLFSCPAEGFSSNIQGSNLARL